jgi:uncharacterized protein (DUF697 family)
MAQKSSSTSTPTDDAIAEGASRDETALNLVNRFALWSGVAGLIPIPVIDVATVGGLQIQMVRRLSQIYDVDFSENRTKAVVASLVGSLIPATSGLGAASLLKAVPVLGTIAAGFVMPALSAGATFAIGKAFIETLRRAARCWISTRRIIGVHQSPARHVGFTPEWQVSIRRSGEHGGQLMSENCFGPGCDRNPGMLGPGRWRDGG